MKKEKLDVYIEKQTFVGIFWEEKKNYEKRLSWNSEDAKYFNIFDVSTTPSKITKCINQKLETVVKIQFL